MKNVSMRFFKKIQIQYLWTFECFLALVFIAGFFVGSRNYASQITSRSVFVLYPSTVPGALSQNDAIISVSLDLPLETVYRFVRSARTSCSSCHIILFVHSKIPVQEGFQALAMFYSVTYMPYDTWMPPDTYARWPSIATASLRWIIISHYLKHLDNIGTGYRYVFICDARDAMFQRNIFDYSNEYEVGLFTFQETAKMTIGTCPYNSKWIRDCYGEAELDLIGNKSIICAGTVLGSWRAMINYLSTVEQITSNRYRQCNDQGIHNYIVHRHGINNTKIHVIPHETGFVGTLGYDAAYTRNRFGLVLNQNRQVYAVVHQFDRSKQANDQFNVEYQLWPRYTQI